MVDAMAACTVIQQRHGRIVHYGSVGLCTCISHVTAAEEGSKHTQLQSQQVLGKGSQQQQADITSASNK